MSAKRILSRLTIVILLVVQIILGSTAHAVQGTDEKFSDGDWKGDVKMGTVDVVVVLHVVENPDHLLTAKMDIPSAGRKDVAIDEFSRNGIDIKLSIKDLVDFDGKLNQSGDAFCRTRPVARRRP